MIKTPSLQELLEAGVHFGHKLSRSNPRMKQYIYGAREGVQIIDLVKSEELLKEACNFVYELGKSNGRLLFVGTKKQARPLVEEAAKAVEAPYLSERWIGGFFTNFDELLKTIKKLKELKEAKEKGTLSKYTKKEQLLIDRKIAKLERNFKGVGGLETVPEAIFIVDTVSDHTAAMESNKMGIKVVAIADSNSDPSLIDYPIPGNDDAIKSIKILISAVAQAYGEGKSEAGKIAVKEAAKQEKEAAKEAAKALEVDEKLKDEVAAAEEAVEKKALEESERKVA